LEGTGIMNEEENTGGETTEHIQALDGTVQQPGQRAQAEEANVTEVG